MQNMWISVVLIVLVIVLGLIAGARLSTPGPQRRAVYFAFGTLAVLAIWFFIFVAFFPAEWIVPFFTVACIVIPICIYMGVARGSQREPKKASPSKKSFEIPKKDVSVESAKEAATKPAAAAKVVEAPATKPIKKPAETPAPKPATKPTEQPAAKPAAKSAAKTAEKASKASADQAPKATGAPVGATQPTPPSSKKKTKSAAQTPAKDAETAVRSPKKAESEPTKMPSAKSASPTPIDFEQPKQASDSTSVSAKPAAQPAQEPIEKPVEPRMEKAAASHAVPQPTEKAVPTPTSVSAPAPMQVSTPISSSASESGDAVDPQISAAADIDILVNKAVAEEIVELEELVRPFGASSASATFEQDQGPDLNIGSPVSSSAPASESAAKPVDPIPTEQTSSAPSTSVPSPTQIPATPTSTPATAPTAQPTPTPAPKPAKKLSAEESFAEFSARAAALRDQGAYAIAAMLYEEAAVLAPTANAARDTQFDELACYVKAGDAKKAKELAAKLRQSSVLTRFERIKLDAVERMS